jgi:hypothetical protein
MHVNKTIWETSWEAQKAPVVSCFIIYKFIHCKEQICTLRTKCQDKDLKRCEQIWKGSL